jgi:hypothetical protein
MDDACSLMERTTAKKSFFCAAASRPPVSVSVSAGAGVAAPLRPNAPGSARGASGSNTPGPAGPQSLGYRPWLGLNLRATRKPKWYQR